MKLNPYFVFSFRKFAKRIFSLSTDKIYIIKIKKQFICNREKSILHNWYIFISFIFLFGDSHIFFCLNCCLQFSFSHSYTNRKAKNEMKKRDLCNKRVSILFQERLFCMHKLLILLIALLWVYFIGSNTQKMGIMPIDH